jgi:putative aldouronate transport system permease protein
MALSRKPAGALPAKLARKTDWKNYFAQYWFIYVILAIVLAYYVIFKYIPMYGVLIAFKRYTPSQVSGQRWVGLRNFERFFSMAYFMRGNIRNTVL